MTEPTAGLPAAALAAPPAPRMPTAEVYELEYVYSPWGKLLRLACAQVAREAPAGGSVIDYMCGTGYLLNSLHALRPDLHLAGCSLDPFSHVTYAQTRLPDLEIRYQDALDYAPASPPDVVVCTGGLHHLPRSVQARFVTKAASELQPAGLFVVGEELIGAYRSEAERRRRVLEMTTLHFTQLLDRGAPAQILTGACDRLANDLLERGEYKMSLDDLTGLLAPHFAISVESFWPTGPAVGHVLLLARRREAGLGSLAAAEGIE